MNSRVITIGTGKPVIGVIGLVHGNEPCGGKVLDELQGLASKSTVKLVYANLAAARKNKEYVESNLNRVFPGKPKGDLEERTAYELGKHLRECDYVIDVHSTSYPTEPFTISTIDSREFEELASLTGLSKYVIMTEKLAHGKALIDYVNRVGGKGVSFEAGEHNDSNTLPTARRVVKNFLTNLKALEGKARKSRIEKHVAFDVIRNTSKTFRLGQVKNFGHLAKGTVYGTDGKTKHALEQDCHPIVLTDRPGELVMLVSRKA